MKMYKKRRKKIALFFCACLKEKRTQTEKETERKTTKKYITLHYNTIQLFQYYTIHINIIQNIIMTTSTFNLSDFTSEDLIYNNINNINNNSNDNNNNNNILAMDDEQFNFDDNDNIQLSYQQLHGQSLLQQQQQQQELSFDEPLLHSNKDYEENDDGDFDLNHTLENVQEDEELNQDDDDDEEDDDEEEEEDDDVDDDYDLDNLDIPIPSRHVPEEDLAEADDEGIVHDLDSKTKRKPTKKRSTQPSTLSSSSSSSSQSVKTSRRTATTQGFYGSTNSNANIDSSIPISSAVSASASTLTTKRAVRQKKQPYNEKGERVYCICRQPDSGKFMIQCDNCKDWYVHHNFDYLSFFFFFFFFFFLPFLS